MQRSLLSQGFRRSVCVLCVSARCLCVLCVSARCLCVSAPSLCVIWVSECCLCVRCVSARSVCVIWVSARSVSVLSVSARRLCVFCVSALCVSFVHQLCVSFVCQRAVCVCHSCVSVRQAVNSTTAQHSTAQHSTAQHGDTEAAPHGMNEQARANRDATVEQIMRNELASRAAHRDGNSYLNYREKVCKSPIKQCRGKVPPQCTKKLCHSCCKALSIALQVVEHGVPEGGALVPCSLQCVFTGTPRRPGHEVTAEAWSNHFWRHWVSHLRTNPEELEKWKANRLDSNRSDSPPRSW